MISLSSADLTNELRSATKNATRRSPDPSSDGNRVAIFGVHGISPIQRYAFQDQVATALQGYLNATQPADATARWEAVVHWPQVCSGNGDAENPRPSALRIYRNDDDPDDPSGKVYDVYEGYWSPLSKGKTTVVSALKWLLRATFLGTSSTANIPCTPKKLISDLVFLVAVLKLAAFALIATLVFGGCAWNLLAHMLNASSQATYADLLAHPIATVMLLPPAVYAEFGIDLAIGYVMMQIVNVYRASAERTTRANAVSPDASTNGSFVQKTIAARTFHRYATVVLCFILAALVVAGYIVARFWAPFLSGFGPWYVAAVASAMAALQCARSAADFLVESVLGDVQVYATHDANSTSYSVRKQIIATVASALRGVLNATADAANQTPYYDRIHVMGHSLGATVGMDVLIYLRQLIEEGSVEAAQWERIRSFTTFGSALEKTKFFFDVRQPTLSAAQDQWDNDVYGRFFTLDATALDEPSAPGIYWSNYWYFRDIVANEIVSFGSDVAAGAGFRWNESAAPRAICRNVLLPNDAWRFAWIHSKYLGDPQFWLEVGPILTS